MQADLENARGFAHQIRFRGEFLADRPTHLARPDGMVQFGRKLGLEITPAVTPRLSELVHSVCQRFGLGRERVRAFVHSSADLQAICSMAEGKCLIELTSALVEHLDDDEQAFVIGHELGHFLLDHHYLPLPSASSLERYSLLRAREISADRLGLVACANPEAAIRAVIKTFSGLSERHLRFDAAAFLRSCFDEENRMQIQSGAADTHPSFAVRARCLVHFASIANLERSQSWLAEFGRVDERVFREFVSFSEARTNERVGQIEADLRDWLWVAPLAAAGAITKEQLGIIEKTCGLAFANRLRSNFSAMSKREVETLVDTNLANGLRELVKAIPSRARDRIKSMVAECETAFGLRSDSHPALRLVTSEME